MSADCGAILVGNKTDLERHREVTPQMGRKLAKEISCKFIETSSGLVHNVDELLVGIVAQVKLNTERIRNLNEFDRQRLLMQNCIQEHRHMNLSKRRFVRQISLHKAEDDNDDDDDDDDDIHNVETNTTNAVNYDDYDKSQQQDSTWDDQFKAAADDEQTEKENQELLMCSSPKKHNNVRTKIKERFEYSQLTDKKALCATASSLNNSPKLKNRYENYNC